MSPLTPTSGSRFEGSTAALTTFRPPRLSSHILQRLRFCYGSKMNLDARDCGSMDRPSKRRSAATYLCILSVRSSCRSCTSSFAPSLRSYSQSRWSTLPLACGQVVLTLPHSPWRHPLKLLQPPSAQIHLPAQCQRLLWNPTEQIFLAAQMSAKRFGKLNNCSVLGEVRDIGRI